MKLFNLKKIKYFFIFITKKIKFFLTLDTQNKSATELFVLQVEDDISKVYKLIDNWFFYPE
jgi:hypothetical protein